MPVPYAKGFTSLNQENQQLKLKVKGRLPMWLKGALLRTAPGQFETHTQALKHWFDGFAMLHKFSIEKGEVIYQNRFLHSNTYKKSLRKKKLAHTQFGTDPCHNIFRHFFNVFFNGEGTDNANVSINKLGKEFIALTETPMPVVFDFDDLSTRETHHFKDKIEGQLSTAHPHIGRNQTMYNYLLNMGSTSYYQIITYAPGSKERRLLAKLPAEGDPAYMHTFAMTENYVILTEFPVFFSPLALKFKRKPILEQFQWRPEKGLRFHIIDRRSGKLIKTLKADPYFGFHHVNAFEQEGQIVCDLITYEGIDMLKDLYLERVKNKGAEITGLFRRFYLEMDKEKVFHEQLFDIPVELPRINYRYNTQDYQTVYCGATRIPGNFIDSLVKLDVKNRSEKWWVEKDTYPGEPVFVAKPGVNKEDQGAILSVVFDAKRGNSFLLVLDAASFEEIARAEVPHHIPFGFHGQFVVNDPKLDFKYLHK